MTAHSQLAEPPVPQRRRDPVRRVLSRMRERRRRQLDERRLRKARTPPRQRTSIKRRMRKRKAALALSAGVMGMSTAAIGAHAGKPPRAAAAQVDNPLARLPARDLRTSDELKEALVQEEGVREIVYRDVAGYPTVGIGHLVRPADRLQVGDRVGYDRIIEFFEADLREAEQAVARIVGDLPLFQHEFDALVDLVYNVGEGGVSPAKSPRLTAAILAADYAGIASELEYHYAAGKLARGLVYRSERRQRMFMNAAYEDPRETPAGLALAS
jgi:lysozyme